ncbi:alpha-amylase family glycosyl hydrolase [Virgibacillus halodenitrificans]|uniref:alpha-amylase family glycosyl hydrolase n=1 Tax=Virgibacillus halodenitrificans TaxID=1482 RepID=UPI00045CF8B7|nr:alpha-amylase family glycosyl hydrolase [Virgibacillus halodenitrificans]CDQ32297.1 Beta/alpha-amylase precursor [Virgibacillus halodenitrificans]
MKKIATVLLTILIMASISVPSYAAEQGNSQLEEEIVYNILVDRYHNLDFDRDEQVDTDDPTAYQGGDLKGITEKLDYLKENGYSTIVLSPIMENSADGYHGYWIEDFYKVEEQFGTMKDLNELIKEAHDREIKVVLELVTNFVSKDHPIVKDPSKKDWISKEKNIKAEWANHVAVLNQDNPKVRDFLFDVASYWMDETDIDGFKLHAADKASLDFLQNFTEQIKNKNEAFYLLGDIMDPSANTDEIMNRTSIQAVDNHQLSKKVNEVFSNLGKPVSDIYDTWEKNKKETGLIFVDDESTKRFTQQLSENGRSALTTWKLALTYLYTTPGIPSVFQGSDIPMYGGNGEEAKRIVQFNSGDPDLNEFLDRISALKAQFPVLSHGDFEMVGSEGAMSVFKRTYEGTSMYIAINNDDQTRAISIADVGEGLQLRGYLNDDTIRANENGEYKIGLARESVEVYGVQPDTGYNWLFIGFVIGVFVLFAVAIFILSRKQKKREMAENKR